MNPSRVIPITDLEPGEFLVTPDLLSATKVTAVTRMDGQVRVDFEHTATTWFPNGSSVLVRDASVR